MFLMIHFSFFENLELQFKFQNAGMPDCPASSQSGTGLKKLTMPEQVRYRTKLTQSGIFLVRYRTKIQDAGMPMPALVSSMPMPSYALAGDNLKQLAFCSVGSSLLILILFPLHLKK
jgi:hypothetical protein